MGFLSRLFPKKAVIQEPENTPDYLYKGVWEGKRMPSAGAQAYAWESLGLAQFPVSGPSVHVRVGIRSLQPQQPAVGQAVPLVGIATSAGQIFGQGLYDPASGYVAPTPTALNEPFPFTSEPQAGRIL